MPGLLKRGWASKPATSLRPSQVMGLPLCITKYTLSSKSQGFILSRRDRYRFICDFYSESKRNCGKTENYVKKKKKKKKVHKQ